MSELANLIAAGVHEGLRNRPPDTTWRTGECKAVDTVAKSAAVLMDGDAVAVEVRAVIMPAIGDRVLVMITRAGAAWCWATGVTIPP